MLQMQQDNDRIYEKLQQANRKIVKLQKEIQKTNLEDDLSRLNIK